MHSRSVQKFVEETDFFTLTPAAVRSFSEQQFNAVFNLLEDWNNHSLNLLFVALRRGTEDQITRGKDLIRLVESSGYLSSEAQSLYYELLRELFPAPITPSVPPPIFRSKTKDELFDEMAAALFCLSTAPDDFQLVPEARATYKKLSTSAFLITA